MSDSENNTSVEQEKTETPDSSPVKSEEKSEKTAEQKTNGDADVEITDPKEKGDGDSIKKTPSKKAPPKEEESKEKKKESNMEEGSEDEDSEDEDSGDEKEPVVKEKKLGLYELPIVLEEGRKRERKKVERMEITTIKTPLKDKQLEIPEGAGEKLGDLPRIEWKITKTLSDDLKPLHKLLYNRGTTSGFVRRHVRKFCGFGFKEDSDEYKKKLHSLNRFTTSGLKPFCEVLDLERKGSKDDVVRRIIDFLLKPVDNGKKVPVPKRKRAKGGDKDAKKRKRSTKSEKKKSGQKEKSPKKKAAKSKEKVDEESDNEDDSDKAEQDDASDDSEKVKSDSESEEETVSSEEEAPKPKKRRTETPKKKAPAKKPAPKKTAPKKTPEKKKKVVESDSDDDSISSDDEALVPKKKVPPTDDEIRNVIKKLLDKADLQEITMKKVCKEVYDKYPDFDLVPRKDFIKSTVKQIIR